jgi:type III restriction enzyme
MAQSVITYEKMLPEISGRCPWLKPESYLVKDLSSPTGWREEKGSRRKSDLLLVNRLREDVDKWRSQNYPGASQVTTRLLQFWFDNDHENVPDFASPFHYYFCQREAIETLIYITEILQNSDARTLIDQYAEIYQQDLHSKSIDYQTTISGQRQMLRYFKEQTRPYIQDLPIENLRRYAFKMATGSG